MPRDVATILADLLPALDEEVTLRADYAAKQSVVAADPSLPKLPTPEMDVIQLRLDEILALKKEYLAAANPD